MAQPIKIIFVCLGNIVRSPLAEHMFRSLVQQNGTAENYQICSAGTSGYHVGEAPDSRMRQVAAEKGLVYTGSAKQFNYGDLVHNDIVIAMDASNKANIESLAVEDAEKEKVFLMRAFDPQGRPTDPVPDPYYGGIQGFENAFDIVERSCKKLLQEIEAGKLP